MTSATPFAGSGTDSRLRAALDAEADALAARTRTPFVIPVKEILAAIYRVIPDLPRIPDYDPELAAQQVWRTATEFSLTEIHDDPDEMTVMAQDAQRTITIGIRGEDLDFDPAEAEGFFLAGLAAVAHVKRLGH